MFFAYLNLFIQSNRPLAGSCLFFRTQLIIIVRMQKETKEKVFNPVPYVILGMLIVAGILLLSLIQLLCVIHSIGT